jgi:beta-1,4-mannosyltransferase
VALFSTDVPMGARVTAAARRVSGRDDPWVMGYHPVARMNPYQALLYSKGTEAGFAVVAAQQLSDLSALACATAMGCGAAAHLHWTAPILADTEDEHAADAKASNFLDYLRGLKRRGVSLVWTVHNRLPHRCPHPVVETQLRRELVDLCDVVHIMTVDTPEQVADVFTVPAERSMLAEHPSYLGSYPAHHDPQLVRFETGFEPDDFVVGMLGSIQAYKGIDELMDAVDHVASDVPNLRALVAGIPGRDPESAELIDRLQAEPMIRAIPAKLDDQNMARLTSAVDVMALPYRATLNSGAALLALSFGVPVVGPRLGQFTELEAEGFCLAYDPGDSGGLARALRRARGWAPGVDRRAMRTYVEARTGAVISDRFFTGLRQLLEVPATSQLPDRSLF